MNSDLELSYKGRNKKGGSRFRIKLPLESSTLSIGAFEQTMGTIKGLPVLSTARKVDLGYISITPHRLLVTLVAYY